MPSSLCLRLLFLLILAFLFCSLNILYRLSSTHTHPICSLFTFHKSDFICLDRMIMFLDDEAGA
ncbi:hypothetical protein BDV24DRAFT_136239 [Aspergillus arachidicola]|uniref:Uncharacterized protein n=1 Tax=Aspergillus arachidicola TaxID=656916 RepID=A0A5N6Y2C0_9EURO|nr:hypothetical protein BDV24DRAFT_136239 [Aspergillus arachidicola]